MDDVSSCFTGLATDPPKESKNDMSFDESHESLFSGAAATIDGDPLGNTLECCCTGVFADAMGSTGGSDADVIGEGLDVSTESCSDNLGICVDGVEGVRLEGKLPYEST